jgi:hypothetical protein
MEAGPGPKYEVNLKIESIPSWADLTSPIPSDHPLLTVGGWPLSFELEASHRFAGFATPEIGYPYPVLGGFVRWSSNGYYGWVFGDEDENLFGGDHCPSWDGLANPGAWEGCELPDPDYSDPGTWWPIDETVVPFAPGVSGPGDCSDSCDPADTACQLCEARPEVTTHVCSNGNFGGPCADNSGVAVPTLTPVGPRNLGSLVDGFGYGYNPRLPGLVIVADAGPSIVTENDSFLERPVRTDPLVCRNLAGFVQSVAYTLSDYAYDTSIVAHMNVVPELFTPVALTDADDDYTTELDENSCAFNGVGPVDDTLVVIDGGALECREGRVGSMSAIVADQLITLRAFVVQVDETGRGPDQIVDMNGNGYCDIDDYEPMVAPDWDWNRGDPVLSAEVTFSFGLYFVGPNFALNNDLDDDDRLFYYVLPTGGGGLVGPPR